MTKEVIIAGSLSVAFVVLVAVAFLANNHKAAETPHPSETDNSIPSPETDTSLGKTTTASSTVTFTGNPGGTGTPPEPSAPGSSSGAGVNQGPVALGGTAGSPFPTQQPGPIAPIEPPHPQQPAIAPGSDQERVHIVVHGETLGEISKQYYNSYKYWHKIAKANPDIDPDALKDGQKIVIPPLSLEKPATEPGAPAPEIGPGETLYTVQSGDSLYTIAQKQLGNASRWNEIHTLNKLESDSLRPGDQLRLPSREEHADHAESHENGAPDAATGRVHVVAQGETLSDISKQYYGTTRHWRDIVKANAGLDPDTMQAGTKLTIPEIGAGPGTGAAPHAASQDEGTEPLNAGGTTYVVKSGDQLSSIAKQLLGSAKAWKQIQEANPGIDPHHLRLGQKLHIPGGAAASPAPAPAPLGGNGFPSGPIAPTPAPAPAPVTGPHRASNGIGP